MTSLEATQPEKLESSLLNTSHAYTSGQDYNQVLNRREVTTLQLHKHHEACEGALVGGMGFCVEK